LKAPGRQQHHIWKIERGRNQLSPRFLRKQSEARRWQKSANLMWCTSR